MNSFEDLNDYGDEVLVITDERPFSIIYSDDSTQDYTITIDEGTTHQVPVPIEISEMISIYDVTYSITFTTDIITNLNVSGFTKISDYIYSKTINSLATWESYKSPNIIPPEDSTGFSYIVSLEHPLISDGSTIGKTWTVTVIVNNAGNITTPSDEDYDEDFPLTITGYPQVTNVEDTNPSSSYTVEVYPTLTAAVSTLSSAGSGGTSSFNSGTKKLTLAGTRTQVNSHLASITLTPATDYAENFVLNYKVTNPSSLVTIVTQNFLISGFNSETSNLGINRSYTSNKFNLLFPSSIPQIIEDVYGSPTYTINIILGSAIGEIHLGDGTGWTSATKTFSYTGSKSQINSLLGNLFFIPNKDISSNSTIQFKQYREGVLQTDDTVNLNGNVNPNPIVGLGTYTYTSSENVTFDRETLKYANCDILVIGKGGNGAASRYYGGYDYLGGGGGAGGMHNLTNVSYFRNSVTTTFEIVVNGTSGNSSIYNNSFYILAPGGGNGGPYANGTPQQGGSGGGAGFAYAYPNLPGATRIGTSATPSWLGYSGGASGNTSSQVAGGGGGAGSAGSPGNAGTGVSSSITGTSVTYCIGGRPGRHGGTNSQSYSTYGCGGDGAATSTAGTVVSGKSGINGVVIIKFY